LIGTKGIKFSTYQRRINLFQVSVFYMQALQEDNKTQNVYKTINMGNHNCLEFYKIQFF